MIEFEITISRHEDGTKITIKKYANSNKEAQELAFRDKAIIEFLAGYDGLYNVKVINTEVQAMSKLVIVTKPQLN